jgi:hypothetical protein
MLASSILNDDLGEVEPPGARRIVTHRTIPLGRPSPKCYDPPMSRTGTIALVGVVVILLMAFAVFSDADSIGPSVGVIAAIFGGLIRVLLYTRQQRPWDSVPDDDQMIGRHGPSDDTPQLAGSKCVHCDRKILSVMEAAPCKACKKPLHNDCRKEHRADAHGKAPRAVYR